MGHLLSTVNPEAAAAIKPEPVGPLPVVGHVLRFYPRPGEGRPGRDLAIHVSRVHGNGLVDGLIMYDAQDFRDVFNIPKRSPVVQWPAWDWIEPPVQPLAFIGGDPDRVETIRALTNLVSTFEERLKGLEKATAALKPKRKWTRRTFPKPTIVEPAGGDN